MKNNKFAFTLAEMMVVLLIISLAAAAFLPIMTKRSKEKSAAGSGNDLWSLVNTAGPDIYWDGGDTTGAIIGANSRGASVDSYRLLLNTSTSTQDAILFKQGGNDTGKLIVDSGGNLGLGKISSVSGGNSIAIGSGVGATGANSISIGNGTQSTNSSSIAIGNGSHANGNDSVSIGNGANTTSDSTISVGANTVSGANAIAVGHSNQTTGAQGFTFGVGNQATAAQSMGIGMYAYATQPNSIAIGFDSRANEADSIVLGSSGYIDSNRILRLRSATTVTTNHSIGTESDKRLKNVEGLSEAGLNEIKKVNIYNFTLKKDPEKLRRVGVLAQEIQKIMPYAVTKNNADGYLSVNYDYIFCAAVNSVKQLDKTIQGLVKDFKSLIGRLTLVETKINALIKMDKVNSQKISALEQEVKVLQSQNKLLIKQLKQK